MTDLRTSSLKSTGRHVSDLSTVAIEPAAHDALAASPAASPVAASGPGVIDLDDVGGTIRGFTMFGTAGLGNFDQAGFAVATAGDVDGDGFDDIIVGEGGGYLGSGGAYNVSGMAYLINGKASGFADIELEDLDAGGAGDGGTYIYGGSQYAAVGTVASGIGDINGDGFRDFILGAPAAQTPFTTYTSDGKAYVIFGDGGGLSDIDIATMAAADGFIVNGVYNTGYELGWTATGGGDLNGDGFDDVLISSADGQQGETFVIFGGSGPFPDIDRSSGTPSAAWTFTGGFLQSSNLFRGAMSATGGDINGDGFDDLVLGYHTASSAGRTNNGRVEIWLGGNGGPVSGGTVIGGVNDDAAGASVANLGDMNGDGYDDISISAPNLNSGAAGTAYVVFGKPGGIGSVDLASLTDGFFVATGATGDHLATDIASAGDVNGDGYDDVILSTANAGTGAGEAYVLFGRAGATNSFSDIDLSLLTLAQGFKIIPEGTGDFLGGAVSSAGDLDGDGYDDLLVGAQGARDSSDTNQGAGRAYVIFGSDTIAGATSTVTHQGTPTNNVIPGSAGDDVMIGGQGDDVLLGGGGQDVLRGGEGDDVLQVGDNTFRRIDGGTGNNTLLLGGMTLADADFLRVSDVSSILLQDGTFSLTLGAIASNALDGRSVQVGNASAVAASALINGLALDEKLSVNLSGDSLAVTLFGGLADDDLAGGAGNDAVMGGAGGDTLNGGGGRDRAMYAYDASGVTVDLLGTNPATNDAAGDVLSLIEDLSGSLFADSLYGDDFAAGNRLFGMGGNDSLDGRNGADTLFGGVGDDTLVGGGGVDTASYQDVGGPVSVNLSNPAAQNTLGGGIDTLSGIENLIGTTSGDDLVGDSLANDVNGAGGNDTLTGDGGADTLRGSAGDDTLAGGAGSDALVGDGGYDWAVYTSELGPLDFDLKSRTATIGADVDSLRKVEAAWGTVGADRFAGDQHDNYFLGDGGADSMLGRNGDDSLDGGAGADLLKGGQGEDVFLFRAVEAEGDKVLDFDGNGPAAGDQLFFFGYGTDGTFTDLGGGMWEIANLARTIIDVIDLGVGTTVHTTDYVFDPV